ncbi:MAG: alkaline phosphatase family protein [Chitinophagales bacterium]|nr:alkaline phosphatase family protein [Chitinophagales bacterium]
MMKKKPKFLLLGWDSADWKVINPLMDAGLMPALESIVNKGVMGNIATLDPPLSPMLWTSIATGKYAFKHGVHGFLEACEDNKKVRAVTNESINTSTVWEILNKNGYKTNVVSWWPSHPAGELNGVQISNFFGKAAPTSKWYDWAKVPGSVYPQEYEEVLNGYRVHPGELDFNQLSTFIPKFHLLKEEDQNLINLLASDLAECISVHSAATYLAEHTEWDFMAVYYNAIDHISHCFMKYHPPKLAWIKEEKFELFQEVINAIYRFHDLMLARWLELVDEDCYVMVLSDHGFHSDHMRVKELPKEPAAIAREHNYLGMLAMKGPGIKKDARIYGSNLLDVCPTILSIFDLAIGKDMDGKILQSAFEEIPKLKVLDTWDEANLKNKNKVHLLENADLVQQLVDLGYVDAANFDSPVEVKRILDENNFYLARSYYDAAKYQEASWIMDVLCQEHPQNIRYLLFAAEIAAERKEVSALEACITKLEKLDTKAKAVLSLLKGKLAFLQNDYNTALLIFQSLLKTKEHNSAYLEYQIANSFLKLHKYKEAIEHYQFNLKANPSSAHGLHGMGVAYLGLEDYEKAAECLIDSVAITYFNPSAHFHLGIALKNLSAFEEAEQAFLVAKQLAPAMAKARLELIALYENELANPQKLQDLKEELQRKRSGTVYVVSGLPRSGTSMMMQALEAGGLELLVDNKRKADLSNPKGYYEHEAVKRLASENAIILEAKDKGVKVICSLLRFLPPRFDYKVILMKRPVKQVLSSQELMLVSQGKMQKESSVFEMDKLLVKSYDDAKAWMEKSANIEYLEVAYEEVLANAPEQMNLITQFLKLDLKEKDMVNIIDKSLHRNK